MPLLAAALPLVGKVLDRVLPDKAARDAAKLAMLELEQNGEFREDEIRMSAIVAEANSKDPFTSRARPGFFYVMYFYMLFAPIMGIVAAINPDLAGAITQGIKDFLDAIPDMLWNAFIVGFLGYGGMRTFEKIKGVSK